MPRLGLGLGLNRGGFIPFSPFSLNPFLYFDARSSMVAPFEQPTLDLDPSNPSSLDIITATRAGVATYTDANGVIQSASPNTVRVDHVQGEELTPTKFQRVGYTDFSQGWSTYGLSTVETGDGYEGQPSVIVTADQGNAYAPYSIDVSTDDSVTYTYSVFLKSSNLTSLRLRFAGTASSSPYQVISISSEWQKFTVSFLGASGGGNVSCGVQFNGFPPEITGQIEIAMPQVEEGTTASDFVENTTGSPKFIASATYAPRVPMILVEPAATNLLTYSEDFSSGWSKNDTSIVGGQLSPSGNETAFLLKGNNNASRHNLLKLGITNTVTGSFSIFAKAKELRYLQIASANTSLQYANFDLLSGTIGTVASDFSNATIEPYPDGWYRITVVSPNRYNGYYISLVSSLTAVWLESWSMPNDTDGLYIWGAQLEEGSVATSYIPTNGSTVTRNADDLVIDGSDFTDFYNQSEGTIYTESIGRGYFDFNTLFAFNAGNSSNDSIYQRSPSDSQVLVVIDSNNGGLQAQVVSSGSVVSTGTLVRRAASFKLNNFKGSQDGVDTLPDTSGTIPTIDRLRIGASPFGLNHLNGHLKRLIYWPYHSDDL